MHRFYRAFALATAGPLLASADIDPVLFLARLRQHVATEVSSVSQCACVETIRRFAREKSFLDFRYIDTIRLEVIYGKDREVFSLPDASRFDDTELSQVVGSGMTSTGIFLAHLRGVLLDERTRIDYHGIEELRGKSAVRFNYDMSEAFSGYRIGWAGHSVTVGYSGSFWADRESGELLRLTVNVKDVPEVFMKQADTAIDYGRFQVGQNRYLLPESAIVQTVHFDGSSRLNQMGFSHCRKYEAESNILLEEPSPQTSPAKSAGQQLRLPPGLTLRLRLDVPIGCQRSVPGDTLQATLQNEIREKDHVLVPKGARVTGRIRRLEKRGTPREHHLLSLEFNEIECNGQHVPLFAWLKGVDPLPGLKWKIVRDRELSWRIPVGRNSSEARRFKRRVIEEMPLPGVGVFLLSGTNSLVPKGFEMTWRTVDRERE